MNPPKFIYLHREGDEITWSKEQVCKYDIEYELVYKNVFHCHCSNEVNRDQVSTCQRCGKQICAHCHVPMSEYDYCHSCAHMEATS